MKSQISDFRFQTEKSVGKFIHCSHMEPPTTFTAQEPCFLSFGRKPRAMFTSSLDIVWKLVLTMNSWCAMLSWQWATLREHILCYTWSLNDFGNQAHGWNPWLQMNEYANQLDERRQFRMTSVMTRIENHFPHDSDGRAAYIFSWWLSHLACLRLTNRRTYDCKKRKK